MKLSLKVTQFSKQNQTTLLLGVYENALLSASAKTLDQMCDNYITKIIKKSSFGAKIGQILPIFNGSHFTQIILVGCGKKEPLAANTFKKIVKASFTALETYQIKVATNFLGELELTAGNFPWKIKQIAEICGEAFYTFDLFKTQKKPKRVLQELILSLPGSKWIKPCQQALAQGEAIAKGIALTKNLANMPSNICTPTYLADQAKHLAKTYANCSVNVLDEKAMKKLKMGGILGVAQGSAEEAKLICIEYKGHAQKGKNQKIPPIALVGKGVTFDTGGNSLKSADSMVGMKYDMCGAATVLGTLVAAAELKLPLHLVGIIPAVENMPGGKAYKPEDILTTLSGQTVEVISTDAEGRIILADALTYCERYQPETVIDIATLTGAVVIALGHQATGLLSNNEQLAQQLLRAGIESADRAWELPLWEEYQDLLRSPFADMANVGGRAAGAITAACFLSRFAKKFKWAHLDVAGTAATMSGGSERQATGRPVNLLAQYLINRAEKNVTS